MSEWEMVPAGDVRPGDALAGTGAIIKRVDILGATVCRFVYADDNPTGVKQSNPMSRTERVPIAREIAEMYSVHEIRAAFARHARPDDWGVPSFYEEMLVSALRGNYDEDN